MIEWLRGWLTRGGAEKKEASADRAEERAAAMEDRGIEQTARLDAATQRVSDSVGAIKRIETIGAAYERAEEERRGSA